jgi:ankyrin repeat protein
VKEIDRLVSLGTDVNARGKDGITPLFLAMWAKNKAGFLRLLERGADPNLQLSGSPGAGSSIMSVSALVENDSDWLEIVLKHRGNPNLVNPPGFVCKNSTPIFDAIRSRRARNLDLLIKAGAKIDYQDACGDTAMIYAARAGWYDSVYRLLEAGADYRIRNTSGYDLADWIVESTGNPKSELGQWREKAMAFLKRKGVDFDATRKKLAERSKAKSS